MKNTYQQQSLPGVPRAKQGREVAPQWAWTEASVGGFDFLGYHFERGYRWPRKKSLDKLKDALRAKTKRTRSDSMEDIFEES